MQRAVLHIVLHHYFAAMQSSVYTICASVCLCMVCCASRYLCVYTNAEEPERCIKNTAHRTYSMQSALCVRKRDAVEAEEQLNLAQHETEKSPGPIQDNLKTIPAEAFSSLKAISHPHNLLINARPVPCGLLSAWVFLLLLTAISPGASVRTALGPQLPPAWLYSLASRSCPRQRRPKSMWKQWGGVGIIRWAERKYKWLRSQLNLSAFSI